jgi:hypothetical protein
MHSFPTNDDIPAGPTKFTNIARIICIAPVSGTRIQIVRFILLLEMVQEGIPAFFLHLLFSLIMIKDLIKETHLLSLP